MDITTLSLAKKYANKVAAGFSSVRVDGNNLIFTLNDGTKATMTIPAPENGSDGISVIDLSIDENGNLLCHMSDGSTINAGKVPTIELDTSNLISFDNTKPYDVTTDYQPAHKKYVDNNKYSLPIASADTLGGIKIGENLTIDEEGRLNALASSSGEEIDLSDYATKDELNTKVDKIVGKSLIADAEIERLSNITNYDDTEIKNALNSKANINDIPINVSQLINDSGYLNSIPSEYITEEELNSKGYLTSYTETDPVFSASASASITNQDITNWNNKSNFSGSYNNLTDKPFIPTKTSELSNDSSFASESYVMNAIANAQLGGGDTEIDLSGYATKDDLINKVDKVIGKSLIADTEIERLSSVTNYNDTEIKNALNSKANISDIPTKISQLTNDSKYLTVIPDNYLVEEDFVAITEQEILDIVSEKTE